jgi:ABC-type antimicrobial peptide transport system permease subunit
MLAMPFRRQPGENASCLNIYQTQLPTILGVPQRQIERGGFKFIGAVRDNPWTVLNDEITNGEIPVLGDMNTLMYSLHKAVGTTIEVPDEKVPGSEENYKLKIAGMFDGSVFQGVLLMSEENFLKLYPDREGYQYFLVGDRRYEQDPRQLTSAEARRLSDLLESGLVDYGFDAEPVVDRLANFLAVQNTYLSTFQTLGGLGLLLGTLGLATVMLRNVLERRPELALLRAVGFRNGHLALLVLLENAFLLLWGLVAGTVSALLAMTPHLLTIGADVPWASGGLILGSVFVVGMLAAFLAVRAAIRTPILASLRSE